MNNTNRSSARAVRRLVYMSAQQLAALKKLSKRTGTSQAALFRTAIDLILADGGKRKVKS